MSTVQYILFIIPIVIMLIGLFLVIRSIRNRSHSDETKNVTYDKNGIPIIPRHERDIVDKPDIEDALAGETTITPDRSYLQPVMEEAGDDLNSDIDAPKSEYSTHHPEQLAQNNTAAEHAVGSRLDEQSVYAESSSYTDASSSAPSSSNPVAPEHSSFEYGSSQPNQYESASSLESVDNAEEDLFSSLASATENLMPAIETAEEPEFGENSPLLDQHLLAAADEYQNSPLNHAEQNINITLMPKPPAVKIHGTTILSLVEQYGLKYGAMNMFHRYENKDGTGILWFSMMGITEEGIAPFDLNTLPTSELDGLVLFLSLPHPKALQGFDSMMSIVSLIAKQMDMQVLDEDNETLTRERKQQLRTEVHEYQQSHRKL